MSVPQTMNRLASLSSLVVAIAVGCGAFGAHALRGSVPEPDLLIWEKAVLYHLVHGLACVILALALPGVLGSSTASRLIVLLLASILVFSGSLYLLVLLNQRWLGMITPVGGMGFIIAWIVLARLLWKKESALIR